MDKSAFKVAVPSEKPGGLKAKRSGHFGRCDCFTIAMIQDGKVMNVSVIENPPHVEGGCLGPVNLLAEHEVNAIIVSGIGMRPLEGFRQAEIAVYVGNGHYVDTVINALMDGELSEITDEAVCGDH